MTEEQLTKSLETKQLILFGWRKFTHYNIVWMLFLLGAFSLFLYMKRLTRIEGAWIFLLIFSIFPLGLSFVYYKRQRNELKFKMAKTNLPRQDLDKIIQQVSLELKWHIVSSSEKVIEAKTSPGFLSGSWGELITIIFEKDMVLVNSICDPDKRSSVVSAGRNKININRLLVEIENASR